MSFKDVSVLSEIPETCFSMISTKKKLILMRPTRLRMGLRISLLSETHVILLFLIISLTRRVFTGLVTALVPS